MSNLKSWWSQVPNAIQVPIYVGLSSILATLVANIQNLQAIDYRAIIVIILTIGINVLAYLVVRTNNG